MGSNQPPAAERAGESSFTAPAISLPKGGGAIRGVGEKFGSNPVTGTGSMSIPIFTSPARSGFAPQLSLSYDSGNGNGPFGFGWGLSLPAISRRTDKGLPRYVDEAESDVFVLSGAEDLVPVVEDGTGGPRRFEDRVSAPGFVIHRYRPRVEGLFARIERWTKLDSGEVHWRTITRDNVTSLFGLSDSSRIHDPPAPGLSRLSRIFTWLLTATYDDKGNAAAYEYVAEDDGGIDRHSMSERGRARGSARYLKRIRYGNRTPNRDRATWKAFDPSSLPTTDWLFELLFDYDEGHYEDLPLDPQVAELDQHRFALASSVAGARWSGRPDPFSSYRAGFEVRTHRRCRRVMMFHHIPPLSTGEPGYDGLVRATELDYADIDLSGNPSIEAELAHPGSTRLASFIRSITQSGFARDDTKPIVERNGARYATYLKRSLPPIEFDYSRATIQDDICDLDPQSLENLPEGLGGSGYQWVDLDGEGISGVLAQQAQGWFYKPNLGDGRFGPMERIETAPSLALAAESGGRGRYQFLDLDGDGQLDLAAFSGPIPGFFERTTDAAWEPFRPFAGLPQVDWEDPNVRFVDLDGDGRADVLIARENEFQWHASQADRGFGPAMGVSTSPDEESGPRLVFADGAQSVYLADMSGDGLTDLVRIRNGEVCYWPNLGYGRFGAKITMDNSPWFDAPDQFDQRRVRLADIDGSGSTDIIYLAIEGARLYFNQSGNRLSNARILRQFPGIDQAASVVSADLLGNGTACLVWSSYLPMHARRNIRYIDLMGGTKPHMLTRVANNLGAETLITYAASTQYYLRDKHAGRPWITRLPFPVHVVERVETVDRVSGNRFVSTYDYHHGHFDGVEREFRGFGLVEQRDTEEFATLDRPGATPRGTNFDASSHVPPVLTRTWFHTGLCVGRARISRLFAEEYYQEPGITAAAAKAALLEDTVLPVGLDEDEEEEACRALRGSMLRQEVFGLDGSAKQDHPYSVKEQNFDVRRLQARQGNRHSVFFTHPREAVTCHYERNPTDPRVMHEVTLEVDDFGNVLRSASIGYGRRAPDTSLTLAEQDEQARTLATLTESRVTNPTELVDDHRTPLACESKTYELTGMPHPAMGSRYSFDEVASAAVGATALRYEEQPTPGSLQKRLIKHARTYFRSDRLDQTLALGVSESLALPAEQYTLAYTPGLVAAVFGARVDDSALIDEGRYAHTEGELEWWIPAGRIFYSADPTHSPAQELAFARLHFFGARRFRDPFHTAALSTETFVEYDEFDLVLQETRDSLGNQVTAGERSTDSPPAIVRRSVDYRVLQPTQLMDPNRNRSEVSFDALGLVAGTAVMGKPAPSAAEGDSLKGFRPDLTRAEIQAVLNNPRGPDARLRLGDASSRVVYDIEAYQRSAGPTCAATFSRESHVSDLGPVGDTRIFTTISYSDGFGREIQKKAQAEAGPVPSRDQSGQIVLDESRRPVMTPTPIPQRWIASGWTVFNNKGKPVRQYEPFFSDTHRFEPDIRVGVSPVLFYDPAERIVATLHPNHTWEKIVFDPWRQETWDSADTVLTDDPSTDPDVGGFFKRIDGEDYLPTWHSLRTDPVRAAAAALLWPDQRDRDAERLAAERAEMHALTPTVAHFDSLGRACVTVTHNKYKYSDSPEPNPPVEEFLRSRVLLDIQGNHRAVMDAAGRTVMRYDYNLAGTVIHQASMEAGERWTLADAAGKPIRVWDSRGHLFRTLYDAARRPIESRLSEGGAPEIVVGRTVYGETQAAPEASNLRGRAVQLLDQAGLVATDLYDFKGNLLRRTRRLAITYNTTLDHAGPIALDSDSYISQTRYDAMNRVVQSVAPHRDAPGQGACVIQPIYNEANLLDRVDVWLPAPGVPAQPPADLLDPATADLHAVTNIDYDEKGQRRLVEYGNGVKTEYQYDPLTLRLIRARTRRNAAPFPGDCPQPALTGWPGCGVLDLHYFYDPAGNIAAIRDDAQQTVFFNNRRVEPSAAYMYDALYRLIEAEGRELLNGVLPGPANPSVHSYNDVARRFSGAQCDGNRVGRYLERYAYDAVGNMLSMKHRGTDPAQPGWRRDFTYEEPSQLDLAARSNRLTSTHVTDAVIGAFDEIYSGGGDGYDPHGNMLRMPHLPEMLWDFKDQLRMTRRQAVNTADADGAAHDGEKTWYVYDAQGQRVRKVTEGPDGRIRSERLYLGGFEIFRQSDAVGTVTFERETLHVMDGAHRVALVESRTLDTAGIEPGPELLIRYQFGNHLGSAALELDDLAQIISYEEFTPYGSTAYEAMRLATTAPKRYRFTGKERDEESGLCYHGARYYVPWLGRWPNCDPKGLVDGGNLYQYVRSNPLTFTDTTGTQCDAEVTNCGDPNDPRNHVSFESFRDNAVGPWTEEGLRAAWDRAHATPAISTLDHPDVSNASPSLPETASPPPAPQPDHAWRNRGLGLLQVVGGGFEIAGGVGGGLASCPETLGAGCVAGGVLALHGLDTAGHGLATLWSGKIQLTYTNQAGQGMAHLAGADDTTARWVGAGLDVGVGMGSSLTLAATRTIAVESGTELVHLTTPEAATAIESSQTLSGSSGIYAGPASNAATSGIGVTLRTGLRPGTYASVPIPPAAVTSFVRPTPIGLVTSLQFLTGQVHTAPGAINMATGAFTAAGTTLNHGLFYAVDAAAFSGLPAAAPALQDLVER
jgi:RHS repeat-associated protein